jgi:anti-sigma regulatory factor (Ser/Thr protein kinase)
MQRNFKKATSSLGDIFAFLDEQMSGTPVSSADHYGVHFVVEELFTNMVKYGTASSLDVSVDLEIRERTLVLRLIDHDVDRFDPNFAPVVDPATPLSDRRIGGLGIHLVKQMVNDLQYDYTGRCSTITIIKNLEP